MNYLAEYRSKLISADEAVGKVKSGMWLDYGYFCGFPSLFDEQLAKRVNELDDIRIRAWAALVEPQVLKADPDQRHFIYNSWQLSTYERKYHNNGICSHIPSNMGEMPSIYRQRLKGRLNVAILEVSPMDKQGYFNFGTAITYEKAVCDAADHVIVEVNESQPFVYGGYDESIHVSQVDYVVENDRYPIAELPLTKPTDVDKSIAEHIIQLIDNGATIQLGIGGIPDAIGAAMVKSGLSDLGIHTGMMTDSMIDLIDSGIVTNRKKTLNPGKAVHCCAMGSRRLYEYLRNNSIVAGFPCDYTHNPEMISQNFKQVTINNALKVDLRGQVCSESAGHRQISGTGGQLDWVRGANLAEGGKAFICLPSTHMEGNKRVSNIMPLLEHGDVVTVPSSDVSYIVTEFGLTNLKGKTIWERAKSLISISHPDFRDELTEAAYKINFITRGTVDTSVI